MMKKIYLIVLACLSLCSLLKAQTIRISGKVTNEKGSPIIGASVQEKTSKQGVATNEEGRFTISVRQGATLQISSIGYDAREIVIKDASEVSVSLKDAERAMSEVVVTALGIRREKKALGYATSTVGKKDLESRPEGDLARILNGKAPGVNILSTSGLSGSGTNIVVRSINSLTGDATPLFIVDGVPFDASTNAQADFRYGNQTSSRFLDLDPNNIESVDVLKGLSATTLYGEAGRNGVIVITTKNSSVNQNKKASVTLNQSLFFTKVANLPDYQDTYGAGFHQLLSFAFSNWGPAFTNPPQVIRHPYDRAALNGALPEYIGAPYEYKAYNSVPNFFRTGIVRNTSLNVAGGGSSASYNLSFSYLDDEGFTPGNRLFKTTLGAGGSAKLANHLNVSGTFNYVIDDVKAPPTGYSNGSSAVNGTSLFGDLIYTPRSIDLMGLPYENPVDHSSIYYRDGNDIQNPRWTVANAYTQDKVTRIFGSMQLQYEILKNLSLTYRLGFDRYNEFNVNAQNKGAIDGWPNGIYRTTNGLNNIWDHTVIANYNTHLSSDWTMNLDVGVNSRETSYEQSGINSTQQLVYGLFDHSNFISHGILNEAGLDLDFKQKWQTIGAFAQALFGYKEFLYINAGGRNSWVSTLEEGNNSLFYPSLSVSFIPTFAFTSLIGNSTLNYLKVRAGFATSARFPEDPYTTRPTLDITTNLFVDRNGNVVNSNSISDRAANPDLKPELQKEFEVGVEGKFFHSRLSLDFTAYQRTSRDQILDQALDGSTGFLLKQVNAGNLRNRGIELGLGFTVVKSRTVTWQLDGNFTLNRSHVYDMPPEITQIVLAGFNSQGTIAKNGYPLGVLYGTYAVRDPKTNELEVDVNGNYIISPDQRVIGDPNPDYRINGISTLTYKGISFRMQWDFTKGGDIFSRTVSTLLARGLTKDTDFDRTVPLVLPGVKEDGTPNDIQTTATNAYFNRFLGSDDFAIWDATVIRLREISLSYSLPAAMLSKTPFGSISFIVSGQNLWYKTPNFPKYSNFDPETSSLGVGNSTAGFEFLTAPSSRRFGASIRLTF